MPIAVYCDVIPWRRIEIDWKFGRVYNLNIYCLPILKVRWRWR